MYLDKIKRDRTERVIDAPKGGLDTVVLDKPSIPLVCIRDFPTNNTNLSHLVPVDSRAR